MRPNLKTKSVIKFEIRITKSERLSCHYSEFEIHEAQSENEVRYLNSKSESRNPKGFRVIIRNSTCMRPNLKTKSESELKLFRISIFDIRIFFHRSLFFCSIFLRCGSLSSTIFLFAILFRITIFSISTPKENAIPK
jgi:hypothetical protein